MGKTYIDVVKYLVKGTIEIDGIVEKPDVVGAIFGQTEGLLGDELDLRELQKSGRIGRIEIDIKTKLGKSVGVIALPSSLDKAETAILAAALETVDRVGPCNAKVIITGVEDTRSDKRAFVLNRAKELLGSIKGGETERKQLSIQVKDDLKAASLVKYGSEKLAAGPDVDSSKDIIVVEGRADVVTMLKNGYNNVISLMGSVIPKTVVELSKKKEVTLFVDGDRGGDIIVKQLAQAGKVAFVAKAPDGKEVEELTMKEIIKCLRNRLPLDVFSRKASRPSRSRGVSRDKDAPRDRDSQRDKDAPRDRDSPRDKDAPRDRDSPRSRGGSRSRESPRDRDSPRSRDGPRDRRRDSRRDGGRDRRPARGGRPTRDRYVPKTAHEKLLDERYAGIAGSMKALLLDQKGKEIAKVPVAEMMSKIESGKKTDAVVFDGIITQRLVELANSKKISYLVGLKKARIEKKGNVKLVTNSR